MATDLYKEASHVPFMAKYVYCYKSILNKKLYYYKYLIVTVSGLIFGEIEVAF